MAFPRSLPHGSTTLDTSGWPSIASLEELPLRPPTMHQQAPPTAPDPAPTTAAADRVKLLRRAVLAAFVLAAIVAVVWLAGVVLATPDGTGLAQPLDDTVASWISGFRTGAMIRTAEVISFASGTIAMIVWSALAGVWIWRRTRRWSMAALPAATVIATQAVVQSSKVFVDRPRPQSPTAAVHALGAAFPSGHASTAAALAVVLTALVWSAPGRVRGGRVLFAGAAATAALTVAGSRLVLGVHWLSDVGMGLMVGAVVATSVVWFARAPGRVDRSSRKLRMMAAVALVAGLVGVVPVGVSYAQALRAPGYATIDTRSVDWLRGHGLTFAVDRAESWWLWRHLPPTGTGITSLPTAPLNAATAAPGPVSGTATPIATAPPATIPPVAPLITPSLPGEGVWTVAARASDASPSIATTTIRPDPAHPSVTASLAWMGSANVRFALVAGTRQPGGGPGPWGAQVPQALQSSLLAAFNSGYKLKDTPGGALIEGHATGALQDGLASLVVHRDGSATVGQWGRDVSMSSDVVAVRQNLHLVVDHGQPVEGLAYNAGGRWGTVKNALPTWRSGLGVDAAGNLIYVGGNQLTLEALGTALQQAGAVTGMELDIHTHMVTYNLFTHSADGSTVGHKLSPDMTESAKRYLRPDQRDFVAVFSR